MSKNCCLRLEQMEFHTWMWQFLSLTPPDKWISLENVLMTLHYVIEPWSWLAAALVTKILWAIKCEQSTSHVHPIIFQFTTSIIPLEGQTTLIAFSQLFNNRLCIENITHKLATKLWKTKEMDHNDLMHVIFGCSHRRPRSNAVFTHLYPDWIRRFFVVPLT